MADDINPRSYETFTDPTRAHDYTHTKNAEAIHGVDGSGRTFGVALGSHADAAAEANRAANVPWDFALDPRTKDRQMPHQVTPNSIISINGSELTVQQAVALGWIEARKGNNENPKNALPEAPEPAVERAPEHEDLRTEAFAVADRGADITLTEIIGGTVALDQIRAVNEIVESGDVSTKTLNALATQMQVEPSALQSKFEPVMRAMENQARAVLSEGGIEADDVIAYSQQHRPTELQAAMQEQGMNRRTSGYAALRSAYIQDLGEHDPDFASGRGRRRRKARAGNWLPRESPRGASPTWRESCRSGT